MTTTETSKRQAALSLWRSQGSPLGLLWRTLSEVVQRPFYPVYERFLATAADAWRKPAHIGIIMDGNRRFAKKLGASDVAFGHQMGADKLREMLDWCFEHNIPVVTVWGFSLDNFKRDSAEVQQLFELFERKTLEMVDSPDLHGNQVRVRFIGRRDLLPDSLQAAIHLVEKATAHYERFVLNIAVAYGGREEIGDAFREHLNHAKRTGKTLEEVIEDFQPDMIERYLYTSGLPEPDLIIRTSGEVRLSGFMLWQSANSEYYFCDTNWPAFRKIDFLRALRSYDQRQRRFGR
ncbi:MAG TPA: polyprenyl diphosphate synthase [Polyangiales bacterium]